MENGWKLIRTNSLITYSYSYYNINNNKITKTGAILKDDEWYKSKNKKKM